MPKEPIDLLSEEELMNQALQCLRLEVPPRISDDVRNKVNAYVSTLQTKLRDSHKEIERLENEVALLRSEMSWYEEEHWIALEGQPFNVLNWMAHPGEYAGDEAPTVEWGPVESANNAFKKQEEV